jgi:hypothetical protein
MKTMVVFLGMTLSKAVVKAIPTSLLAMRLYLTAKFVSLSKKTAQRLILCTHRLLQFTHLLQSLFIRLLLWLRLCLHHRLRLLRPLLRHHPLLLRHHLQW